MAAINCSELVLLSQLEGSVVDRWLFDFAQLFQWPIMLLVVLLFGYAVMKLGSFFVEATYRWRRPNQVLVLSADVTDSIESLELTVSRELEGLRLCSRVAPMLGLVATMIPLGPALIEVSSGQADQVSANLATAFASVILALIAASVTFAIYTVRRRWLLQELSGLLAMRQEGS